jgi:hypothetical protein
MRSFITCTLHQVKLNDEVKEGEKGRTCSTIGGEKASIWDFGGKARKKEITRKTKT